ncbi:MAG: hypothetical protein GX444_05555 [Myxococcales bacterium]|nr:hypothetical protein [Myxococcales bacterium]
MPRCVRCQREVNETIHQGDHYRLDGFRLHTGKVKRIQSQSGDGEHQNYLQLSDPCEIFLCVDCFHQPGMSDVWLRHFPSCEELKVFHR